MTCDWLFDRTAVLSTSPSPKCLIWGVGLAAAMGIRLLFNFVTLRLCWAGGIPSKAVNKSKRGVGHQMGDPWSATVFLAICVFDWNPFWWVLYSHTSKLESKISKECWVYVTLFYSVVVSNILRFHPDPWGRWTHFDEHIFSNGWVQPPSSLPSFP